MMAVMNVTDVSTVNVVKREDVISWRNQVDIISTLIDRAKTFFSFGSFLAAVLA